MPKKRNQDLHGSAPDKCDTALLLIDVINAFQFPEAPQTLEFALPMARRLRTLKKSLGAAGVPSIYINDNFGRWQSNFSAIVETCAKSPGKEIVRLLRPKRHDYFVLKPMHSAFYSTTLDVLLRHLGAQRLIITGITTDICVLFTANDAYMRDFEILVPQDCVCSHTTRQNDHALRHMQKVLKADIRPSAELKLLHRRR
ncbi:MAG TPA: isochorismatase family cysteine hydrolase [Candidatus Angelobacter sp.]|nr:isochorismatase family cysteine hydrolase [Candidatus Angelobacter sp.]